MRMFTIGCASVSLATPYSTTHPPGFPRTLFKTMFLLCYIRNRWLTKSARRGIFPVTVLGQTHCSSHINLHRSFYKSCDARQPALRRSRFVWRACAHPVYLLMAPDEIGPVLSTSRFLCMCMLEVYRRSYSRGLSSDPLHEFTHRARSKYSSLDHSG